MSYSTKTRGFRIITVDGARYRWCLRSGKDDSTVTLQSLESGRQQAIGTIRGAGDFWLNVPGRPQKDVGSCPGIIPQIIRQALAVGWKPEQRGGPIRFEIELGEGPVIAFLWS
jgi:hypothetical protein